MHIIKHLHSCIDTLGYQKKKKKISIPICCKKENTIFLTLYVHKISISFMGRNARYQTLAHNKYLHSHNILDVINLKLQFSF
jgi:hypothetical protein